MRGCTVEAPRTDAAVTADKFVEQQNKALPNKVLTRDNHPSIHQEDMTAHKLHNEIKPKNIHKSLLVANTVSIGIIHAWLLAALFLPDVFVFDHEPFLNVAGFQEVSFLAYLAAIGSGFVFRKMPLFRWRRLCNVLLILTPLSTCLCLACSAFEGPAPLEELMFILSYLLFGSSLGMAFSVWVRLFAHFSETVALCIGMSLVVSAVFVLALSVIPAPVAGTLIALLPLVVLLTLGHFDATVQRIDDQIEQASMERADAIEAPRRLWLSLAAVGFVFGLSYGYVGTSVANLRSALLACMAVTVIIGLFIVGRYWRTGRNPGYTIPLALLLALGCIGQGLISIFRDVGLTFSFGILFAGQLLFGSILLMQLPLVFRKKQSLATFFMLWADFFGTQFIGVLLRRLLLGNEQGMSFEVVSAGALVLSIVIMAIALRDTSVATAWEYIPVPTFTRKLYASACEAVGKTYSLTPREKEIMMLVGRGRNGTFVQEKLVISKSTFQTHMRNLYKKLDIHSDQELIDVIESEIRAQKDREDS